MKRQIGILWLVFFVSFLSFGNIAAPVRSPDKMGDIFTRPEASNPLRIVRERLFLDVTGGYAKPGLCTASYEITNPSAASVSMPMLFLTHGAKEIAVKVNEKAVEAGFLSIQAASIPWVSSEQGDKALPDYGSASFELSFGPGETKRIDVSFVLSIGYDNTLLERGLYAPQAAHVSNQFKEDETVFWYRYDLFASTSFKGGFGELELSIKVPIRNEIICNLELTKTEENQEAGYYILGATFNGLPKEFIDIKRIYRVEYSTIGVTIGAGCSFPFDGRGIHFTSKAMFDLFFWNHQVSLGIEADPFTNLYRGLFVYTLFPPGRATSYGWFVDLRAGGGLVFDLANVFSPGFIAHCGFKLIPIAYEVSYTLFPFGTGLIHEIGITIELGI